MENQRCFLEEVVERQGGFLQEGRLTQALQGVGTALPYSRPSGSTFKAWWCGHFSPSSFCSVGALLGTKEGVCLG